jgi:hypothetical protein
MHAIGMVNFACLKISTMTKKLGANTYLLSTICLLAVKDNRGLARRSAGFIDDEVEVFSYGPYKSFFAHLITLQYIDKIAHNYLTMGIPRFLNTILLNPSGIIHEQ